MNDSPLQNLPPPPRTLTLKKLAAILAVTLPIAFGLCGLAGTVGMGIDETASRYVIYASLVVEALCLLGLLGTGILALIQSIRRRNANGR